MLLSDEIDLDELLAARCLLDSQDDPSVLGRSLLECAIIRFHQQRKYVLDILRMLLDFHRDEEDAEDSSALEGIKIYVENRLFHNTGNATKRYPTRCIASMTEIRQWLQKLGDRLAAAQTLGQGQPGSLSEEMETVEFARVSLIQQHELLGVVLTRSVENRQADTTEFIDFISFLKRADKYDMLLGKILWPTNLDIKTNEYGSPSDPCCWSLYISVWIYRRRL